MGGFSEGVHAFFHSEKLRKFFVSYRWLFVPAGILAIFYFAKAEWFWWAFAVSLFGELIQLWCFASLDKQSELAYNGLYKYSRNPMYLGRFFIVLGYVMLLGIPWLIAPYAVFYYLYMWHRVQREEAKLKKIFGAPYEDYCQRVNRFFPSFRGMPGGRAWTWSWKLFKQNHGTINLVGMLISYAVAYAWFTWSPLYK